MITASARRRSLENVLVSLTTLFVLASLTARAPGAAPGADKDLRVQGEYVGEVRSASGTMKYGIQVSARGKGNFDAIGFPGGLPGAGGTKTENKDPAKGKTTGNVTRFSEFRVKSFQGSLEIQDGVLTITGGDGKVLGRLKRVARKSSTLGKKPPPEAIVLFDGKSPEHFNCEKEDRKPAPKPARMTEGGLLSAKQGQGLYSKRKFQSVHVHVEFRLPFEPSRGGQGRGNSGCYLQGKYEVQVLDSFGLVKFKDGDCGGIYSVRPAALNMCFPPRSWQTYDIEFTRAEFDANRKKTKNAMMTVYHNGVLIHDKIEVDHTTTAAPYKVEGPEPGPLYFQNHGHEVLYRNIWVVEK